MQTSGRVGRKPLGPALVHHLDGSEHAKERFEVILETIAGKLTVREACQRLSIGEAMFHRMRIAVLQAGLGQLEPRPVGRPPKTNTAEAQQVAELQQQLEQLEAQLATSQVQTEIAHTLPRLTDSTQPGVKKTKRQQQQLRQARRQQKRRKAKKKKPR